MGLYPLALPHFQKVNDRRTSGSPLAKLYARIANALVQLRHAAASPGVHFGWGEHDDRTGTSVTGFDAIQLIYGPLVLRIRRAKQRYSR
jgi:hypothetical protein